MTDEGFNEYWAAYGRASGSIDASETLGSMVESGDRDPALLVGLALIAIAQAIQAQTLGLRHAIRKGGTG